MDPAKPTAIPLARDIAQTSNWLVAVATIFGIAIGGISVIALGWCIPERGGFPGQGESIVPSMFVLAAMFFLAIVAAPCLASARREMLEHVSKLRSGALSPASAGGAPLFAEVHRSGQPDKR